MQNIWALYFYEGCLIISGKISVWMYNFFDIVTWVLINVIYIVLVKITVINVVAWVLVYIVDVEILILDSVVDVEGLILVVEIQLGINIVKILIHFFEVCTLIMGSVYLDL
jgi:hypothetical protein